jgi:hypothetical protein
MLNIPEPSATSTLRPGEREAIEEMASLLAPWGLPISQGRVYAYVLLNPRPVSLDQMAADLEMSKAGAWTAATQLERFGHIRRFGTPGSKRALFGPSEDCTAIMAKHSVLLGALGRLYQRCAETVVTGEVVPRMQELSDFHLGMRQAIDGVIEQVRTRRDDRG